MPLDAKTSSAADRERFVRLESSVILAQGPLSPADIRNASLSGSVELPRYEGNACALEIGGVIIAEGKIITKRGRSFFKISRMTRQDEGAKK